MTEGTKTDGHWDVPLDRNGNMVSWPEGWSEATGETRKIKRTIGGEVQEMDWPVYKRVEAPFVAMPPFNARMKVIDMERGRSAARFTLQDIDTGKTYPMFMVDILAMLENITFEGTWASQKRGANYGVMRIEK